MADGSLIFDTKIDSKGFNDGMSKLRSVGTKAASTIAKSVTAVSAAVAAMGGYAIKASIEFESAFAGVRKTVDATEEEFAMLEKGIRDMAKSMPQSASAIAEVAEAAGQLGIKTENILGFTETMVMLGDATNMSSDQAATALARLANITGMSQTDFDKLGSSIVALGNNLATTESEIVEMSLRLAGTATQVGMTESQMIALAGAMSSVGINAEAGGSSMSRVMQKMNTEVLSGGENLAEFAKISGMSASDFSKAWKEDPVTALTAFIKGLDGVNASGGDVTTVLKELGINSIQEIDTLLRLSGASDVLTDALDLSAEAWEENTALSQEAEQRYKTTESQIQILKNNIDDLAISVGDGLKDSLIGAIDTSIEMIDRLSSAFEQGGLSGLVEEIGSVLADVVVMIADYIPTLLETGKNLIMSFITGIRENLPDIVESAIAIVNSFIISILEILPEILVLGIEFLTSFMQGIAETIPELIPVAMNAIDTLVNSIMENLPLIIDAGMNILMSLVQGIVDNLPTLITQAIDLIILIADKIIENVQTIIDAGLEILMSLIKGIIDNLPKLIEEVPRIINSFASAIYDKLPDIIKAGIEIIMALIKGLIDSIPTIIANIPQIIMAIVNAFTLYNWWNLGKNVIVKLKDGLVSMVKNLGSSAKGLASNAIDTIKTVFSDAPKIGKGLVEHLVTGVKILAESLVTTVKGMGTRVLTGLKSVFSPGALKDIGSNLVKGIWNGISNVTGWILDKIRGFGSSVMNGIKKIFGIKSPSTVMRDEVGKMLPPGISIGFEKAMPELESDVDKELSALTKKMKATVDIESGSVGTTITAGSNIHKMATREVTSSNDDNSDNSTLITGNSFVIRKESDIEKIAIELERLRTGKRRGKGVTA